MAVAITLTLTLSHQGRGDIRVLPEDVFGVGRVVSHLACEMSQLVSCVVHLGDFMEILGYVRFGWRSVFCVVLCGCMNPLRRCAPRPPFAPQKGEDSPPPRRGPGIPRSMALLAPSRAPVVGLLGFAKGAGDDDEGRLYGVVNGG